MPAPDAVRSLADRFRENREAYLSAAYNETQLRREFLDPFFKELGWDVDNEQGYAEAYKDVVHEDAIKIGGATKAPDYAFRGQASGSGLAITHCPCEVLAQTSECAD